MVAGVDLALCLGHRVHDARVVVDHRTILSLGHARAEGTKRASTEVLVGDGRALGCATSRVRGELRGHRRIALGSDRGLTDRRCVGRIALSHRIGDDHNVVDTRDRTVAAATKLHEQAAIGHGAVSEGLLLSA